MRLRHFACRSLSAWGVGLLASGLLVLAAPAASGQTTYTVDAGHITGAAATDDEGPDGTCDADCSLREAVIAANANPGADVITFAAPGTVSLALTGAEAGDASVNDLDLIDDVTIQGHPDGTTVTTAEMPLNAESRAFETDDIAVELVDLAVVDGENSGAGGGALLGNNSPVTLTRVSMSGNQAPGGGAVRILGGSLTVTDSTFQANAAAFDGGAVQVFQADAASFTGSTFTGNTVGVFCCAQEFPQGRGGAIAFLYDGVGPLATIDSSTFGGNSAEAAGGPGGIGGAIFTDSVPLALSDSVLDGNGGLFTNTGGGLHFQATPATSTITNTTISNGTVLLAGGGIYTFGDSDLAVDASTIHTNQALGQDGDGAVGGGIYLFSGADQGGGQVAVQNSTISNNTASLGGGGIHIEQPPPSLSLTGFSQADPGSVSLLHTTLADNDGRSGLAALSDTPVDLRSTLIAANTAANCITGGGGVIVSSGYNLEDADDCGLDQPTDLPDTDPLIGPLADNGGQPQGADNLGVVFTHALLDGSPAIDTADPATCPAPIAVDERGVARPQLDACDIGAYEAVAPVDVGVDKSVDPATIAVGETAVFTIEVTNVGTSTAQDVVVIDVVPDGLTIDDIAPAGVCDPPAGQTITCNLGDLAAGEVVMIDVTVTGNVEGSFVNTASITVTDDTNPDNDSDDATLVVGRSCTGPDSDTGDGIDPGINRVEGLNRIQTAIAASQAACGDGEAPAVVLTRSDLFPDAQAGTPLAIDRGAPLLLSRPEALSEETEEEIQRVLDPGGTVYLLGGTVALSEAVEGRLEALGYETVRFGGQNRFGTAAIIADSGLADPDTLMVANGGDFPDSIVAGAAAAAVGDTATVEAAVLLTSDVNIPPETQDYLDSRTGPDPTIIAIGSDAGDAFPAAEEISGPSRFETAVAVAERFFTDPVIVGLARDDDFADGLTGGALVGRPQLGTGPMLLTNTDALPATVEDYLTTNAASIETAVIFGGTAAVSQEVEDDVVAALGFP